MSFFRKNNVALFSSVALFALCSAPFAYAAPEGGDITAGSASIQLDGKHTNIHQNSAKVVIDWDSFDIAHDETTAFIQPSTDSVALNRIHGADASQIDGALQANGHIMLINSNGVVFGAGAQVDVGSLTVSTADIENEDFMAGNYNFDKAGAPDAAIVNHGKITATDAGLITLVAPRVENHGILKARLGKVQLAAADTFTLDMAGDGLIQVAVSDEEAAKLARNTGQIVAEGGIVAMSAGRARKIVDSLVDNSGIIEASSMTNTGGKIMLGGATVKVSGTLKADGKTGGGEILVGGDYQGSGDDKMEIAENTIVTSAAQISANATDTGSGGRIILWADQNTHFGGEIEAKGGPNGGNGGFTEVSGKKYLDFRGNVDLTGDVLGTLLLDPDDLEIVAGGVADHTDFDDNTLEFGGGTATTQIGADIIETRLSANTNLILQANDTIVVNANITSNGSGDLTLQTGAGGTLTINNAIDVNAGSLTLIGDEIDIAADLSGTGDIQLTSADAAQEIEIGSSDGTRLNLTANELETYLQNGWNSITIGEQIMKLRSP